MSSWGKQMPRPSTVTNVARHSISIHPSDIRVAWGKTGGKVSRPWGFLHHPRWTFHTTACSHRITNAQWESAGFVSPSHYHQTRPLRTDSSPSLKLPCSTPLCRRVERTEHRHESRTTSTMLCTANCDTIVIVQTPSRVTQPKMGYSAADWCKNPEIVVSARSRRLHAKSGRMRRSLMGRGLHPSTWHRCHPWLNVSPLQPKMGCSD